ncbi:hypothetical protein ACQ86N_44885 [Puia sp. P3]
MAAGELLGETLFVEVVLLDERGQRRLDVFFAEAEGIQFSWTSPWLRSW